MNKMNPTEFVQSTINSSSMSMNEWSKELGVSRQAIYNWMGNINIKIRKIYVNKIADISNKNIIWDKNYLLIVDEKDNTDDNYPKPVNQISQSNDEFSLNEVNDNLERQLQFLITKYEHVFNTSSDPMAIAINENYTSMNVAMEKLLGVKKRRGLFGINIYDIVSPTFRDEKKEKRSGDEAIGRFEYKTALQDILGNTIKGKLSVTRFWLPTNKLENILCSIMTFFPDKKSSSK